MRQGIFLNVWPKDTGTSQDWGFLGVTEESYAGSSSTASFSPTDEG